MRYAALILILLSGTANATEVFECQSGSYWTTDGKVLVTALVDTETGVASIIVAGTIYAAEYRVAGFNRRWDFGKSSTEKYPYSFIIKPDGRASYYDFSLKKETSPSQFFKCRVKS